MATTPWRTDSSCSQAGSQTRRLLRLCLVALVCSSALGGVTVAAAHEGEDHGENAASSGSSTGWYGVTMAAVGVVLVIGTVTAERTDRLSLVGALLCASVGFVVAALGIMLL
jgi:cytochrome bd-type quinol oxidase subunit 2